MLADERKEETEAMDHILEELKKLVDNPSLALPSYGGKGEKESFIEDTITDASTIKDDMKTSIVKNVKAREMYKKVFKHSDEKTKEAKRR